MSNDRKDLHLFTEELPRDVRLGAILRDHVGSTPGDVDWDALAARISSRVSSPASPWWTYATRWERLAIPVALAAGIAGTMLLWKTHTSQATITPASDLIADMVSGTAPDVAVRSFARSVTYTAVDVATVTQE